MPFPTGRHSVSALETHSTDSELRRYIMRSTDDLGKAYNQVEQRIHEFGKEIDEKLRPDLEDVRGRAAGLEPRVSRLEGLITPYKVYESDVKKAVKKLKTVEGKVESALGHDWGPFRVDFEMVNHKIEGLTNAITSLTNAVNDVNGTVKEISDAQKENDTALERGFAILDAKVNLLRLPTAKAAPLPGDQVEGSAEEETRATDSDAYKLNSNSQRISSSVKATPPSTPATNHAQSLLSSINDVGRDLLSRLSQGEKIDRDLLQRLATRFSSIHSHAPTSSLAVEQVSKEVLPELRRSGRRTSGLPWGSGKTAIARPTSRKRGRPEEDMENATRSQKKPKVTKCADPLASGASVKARNATPPDEKPIGLRRSSVPGTRSKTKQKMAYNPNDTDNDADDDSPSSPRPRRTSRAIKPTERAGDFMKIRS